jgi:hypothetical protein
MENEVTQNSSGSLLLDMVVDNTSLSLEQLCRLSCVSASTIKVLRRSLQQHGTTYDVAFTAKYEEQMASFTAW